MDAGGFALVGIGQGDPRALKSWARLNKWPGAFYSDTAVPHLPAYVALGARFEGTQKTCCKVTEESLVGSAHGLNVVFCQGCPPNLDLIRAGTPLNANVLVQSGVLCFDGGVQIFHHHSPDIDIPLPAAALTLALQQANTSPMAASMDDRD